MSGIQAPQDSHIVNIGSGLPARVWEIFWRSLGKRMNKIALVTEDTTPDAADLATAVTLVNSLKDKVNAITAAAREE